MKPINYRILINEFNWESNDLILNSKIKINSVNQKY